MLSVLVHRAPPLLVPRLPRPAALYKSIIKPRNLSLRAMSEPPDPGKVGWGGQLHALHHT